MEEAPATITRVILKTIIKKNKSELQFVFGRYNNNSK